MKTRNSIITAYVPLCLPGSDIPCGEAEIEIYPTAEGSGRWDDVSVVGLDGKTYALSDEAGRSVLKSIEAEQPRVWEEIRMLGGENSRVEA